MISVSFLFVISFVFLMWTGIVISCALAASPMAVLWPEGLRSPTDALLNQAWLYGGLTGSSMVWRVSIEVWLIHQMQCNAL